jgi:hypothetical protein
MELLHIRHAGISPAGYHDVTQLIVRLKQFRIQIIVRILINFKLKQEIK